MKKEKSFIFKTFLNSFFWGMKNADNTIVNENTGSAYNQEAVKGLYKDLLEKNETDEVKEFRDSYYRILKKADEFKVVSALNKDTGKEEIKISQKTMADFMSHPKIMENGLKPILIQDNFIMESDKPEDYFNLYAYNTLLEIKRDGYKPKFEIEKFVKKIIIKEYTEKQYRIELYVNMYASQFGKIDAILISALYDVMQGKSFDKTFLSFDSLEFITNRAWNSKNMHKYKFKNIEFVGIRPFDGNFIIEYDAEAEIFNEDVTEQYKTKELTEKYKNETPKQKAVDIFAIERKMKKD